MQALIAVLAAVLGIILGFWLRQLSVKKEHEQLALRGNELAAELTVARAQISEAQSLASARAGFESLCTEREKMIAAVTAERDLTRADLQAKIESELALTGQVSQLKAELANEQRNSAEKILLMEGKFKELATGAIHELGKNFGETSQKEVGNLLAPLQVQLKDFRERVDKVQTENITGVTELKTLIGTLGELNKKLSEEAHNLATALRSDTKAQGNWGETILRNILEKSGLQEGLHYTFQQSFVQSNGDGESGRRRQTDVVVKIPGGRHLIIDSKVSLNSYNDFVNAGDDKERSSSLKKHLACIRDHYNELSSRKYQGLDGLNSPDFVVMFVPIEPAFLVALQNDEGIWFDAYQKRVLLCGPTTVLFVVQIVVDLWRQEQQARNVREVMKRGERLYDKFVGFVADMEKIGRSLQCARDDYNEAMNKLKAGDGNLIGQVEKLKKLGVKSSKSLPKPLLDAAGIDEPLALAAEAAPVEGD